MHIPSVRCVHGSASIKDMTFEMNDWLSCYGAIFFWESLHPGIAVDINWQKPYAQTLLQIELSLLSNTFGVGLIGQNIYMNTTRTL